MMEGALISLALASICIACGAILLWLLVSPHRVWSHLGLAGPRPLPIVGNYLAVRKIGHLQFLEQQINKHGPVFGYYVGRTPRIVIVDLELLKDVMAKMSERCLIGPFTALSKALDILPGAIASNGVTSWTCRRTLSPSFSAMKTKMMMPLLKRSTDVLVEKMRKFAESEESVDVYRLYGAFTLETVLAVAFGRSVDIQGGEAGDIVEAAENLLHTFEEGTILEPHFLQILITNFPWLEPLLLHFVRNSAGGKAMKHLHNLTVGLIKERMQCAQAPKTKDLLQLMIDATVDGDDVGSTKLSSEQIASLSIDFLLAGYETTANTLAYTTYLLAMNPDVQEKLQAEIDQYFEDDPDKSLYEASMEINYLDMVVKETMRMYTPVPRVQRYCNETVTFGSVTIPKGSDVVIPLQLIHRLPQYWPDPDKFDPERFSDKAKVKRPRMAHMPFGWGLRSCIGPRLAQLEIKLVLIELLRRFSFCHAPETVAKLERLHGLTASPKGGVSVKIISRT